MEYTWCIHETYWGSALTLMQSGQVFVNVEIFFVYFVCFFLYCCCCCFSRWQKILWRRTRIWHVHANHFFVVSIYSGDSLSVFTCLNWMIYWKLDTSAFLLSSLPLIDPQLIISSFHTLSTVIMFFSCYLSHFIYCIDISGLVKKFVEMLMKKGPDDCGKDLGAKIVSFVGSKQTEGCEKGKPPLSFLFYAETFANGFYLSTVSPCKRFSLQCYKLMPHDIVCVSNYSFFW